MDTSPVELDLPDRRKRERERKKRGERPVSPFDEKKKKLVDLNSPFPATDLQI